jgi:hypothetical protein
MQDAMQDLMNSLVLVCAAIAALGLGVLLAFAVCRAGFALLREQTRPRAGASVAAKAQTLQA